MCSQHYHFLQLLALSSLQSARRSFCALYAGRRQSWRSQLTLRTRLRTSCCSRGGRPCPVPYTSSLAQQSSWHVAGSFGACMSARPPVPRPSWTPWTRGAVVLECKTAARPLRSSLATRPSPLTALAGYCRQWQAARAQLPCRQLSPPPPRLADLGQRTPQCGLLCAAPPLSTVERSWHQGHHARPTLMERRG